MKVGTIVGLTIGGVLLIGGAVAAVVKKEEVKKFVDQVADEVKKRLKKTDENPVKEAPTETAS